MGRGKKGPKKKKKKPFCGKLTKHSKIKKKDQMNLKFELKVYEDIYHTFTVTELLMDRGETQS